MTDRIGGISGGDFPRLNSNTGPPRDLLRENIQAENFRQAVEALQEIARQEPQRADSERCVQLARMVLLGLGIGYETKV